MDVRDPMGGLWLTALGLSQQAMLAAESLRNAMRRKAGIDGPSRLQDIGSGKDACNGEDAMESETVTATECDGAGDDRLFRFVISIAEDDGRSVESSIHESLLRKRPE